MNTAQNLIFEQEKRSLAALLVPAGTKLEKGKVYLKLLHGRNRPEENLDEWGFAGPIFGPLEWFHITYLQTYRFGRDHFEMELAVTEDMFVWDAKYYGDAEVFVASGLGKAGAA